MAKVRVYELAKELGVESKTVLTTLGDMGEFVRSASSTVEAPVVRRLREKLASEPPPAKKTVKKSVAERPAEVPTAPVAAAPAPTAAPPQSRWWPLRRRRSRPIQGPGRAARGRDPHPRDPCR